MLFFSGFFFLKKLGLYGKQKDAGLISSFWYIHQNICIVWDITVYYHVLSIFFVF